MQTKTLSDCQGDATVLSGLLEAIDLMDNEGSVFDNCRCAVTIAALRMAKDLANDLGEIEPRIDEVE